MSWDVVRSHRQQLSREQGTTIKEWGGRIPVALVYPNTYYLGMSNLGLHAIYRLLNEYGDVAGERAFWAEENRAGPTLSLESQRPLADFAVIAFSITYELDYFNVVSVLRASGIPLYAADRDERHPLVMAGGPAITANPMPLAPFFDCLGIGEAEAILPAMMATLREGIGGQREPLLEELAALPGVYVPLAHSQASVVRQWAANLDDFPVTSVILTPETELGDLYLIEVERGCRWGCRFCLAGRVFYPTRYRSLEKLIALAGRGLTYRRRLGLVGPAVTDHPQIEELLARLRQMGAGLSISSLRVNTLSPTILREIAQGGARTLTLAPEAGSPRLRQVIRKGITEDEILEAINQAARAGLKQLKLYFMLGLPTETDEDIEEIIRLTLRGKGILDRQLPGGRLSLNIAPFVPKAGTPFQWLPMAPVNTINRRLNRLRKALPPEGIKLKWESPAWSQVQAVLARGDARLAEVLVNTEEVSLAGWRRAVEKCHLDVDFYAHQRWDIGQKLPWAVVDSGVEPAYLKAELARALAGTDLPALGPPDRV